MVELSGCPLFDFGRKPGFVATGVKGMASAGQAAKRHELETSARTGNTKNANAIISKLSLQPEAVVNTVNEDSTACRRPEPNSVAAPQDPLSLKRTLHPVAAFGFPFHINRYKLDNRPKSFKISAPLPAGLASMSSLLPFLKRGKETYDVTVRLYYCTLMDQ